MDIQALAMTLSQIKTQSDVGTAVLGKVLDTNEAMMGDVIKMMDRSAMELSVNPGVGSVIDVSV